MKEKKRNDEKEERNRRKKGHDYKQVTSRIM